MKGWFVLALLGCLVLCLLLRVGPQAGPSYSLLKDHYETAWDRDPGCNLPPDPEVHNPVFPHTVAAPMESLVLNHGLSTLAIGPWAWDISWTTRNHPRQWLPGPKRSDQSNQPVAYSGIFLSARPANLDRRAFATAFN